MAKYFNRMIFLIFSIVTWISVDCQLNSPPDQTVCEGGIVKIDWVYGDAANFASGIWSYIDSSSAETTIMQILSGQASATVIGDFNVNYTPENGNGAITLTGVAKASNSGSYKIIVTYSSATPTAEDTVAVTVNNKEDCEAGTTSDGSLKGWEIALIVVGVLVGVAIAVGVGIYVFKHFH